MVVIQKVLLQVQLLVLGSLVTLTVEVVEDLQNVRMLLFFRERFKAIGSRVVGGIHWTCSYSWG